jgi:hypothetical protein
MIKFIKLVHTIIWAVMVAAILYIVYCGLTNTYNFLLWFSIGLIILEGLTLIIYKWHCPLTLIAKKYTNKRDDNFDIYLPIFLARHTKTIFSILFVLGLILVIF